MSIKKKTKERQKKSFDYHQALYEEYEKNPYKIKKEMNKLGDIARSAKRVLKNGADLEALGKAMTDSINLRKKIFEKYVNEADGIEVWFTRYLQKLLDYKEGRNFVNVIEKATISCKNSGQAISDHFVEVTKKVKLGSEAEREIDDLMLTRYACYLIAQNGDPRKEQIAFAQSYFAVQTRKQELIEERIALIERVSARQKLVASETELSKLIYERK